MRTITKYMMLILLALCTLPAYAWYERGYHYHHYYHHFHRDAVYVVGPHRYYRDVRVPGHWVYYSGSHTKVWVPAHLERRR